MNKPAPWASPPELWTMLRRNNFDGLRKKYPLSRFVWDKRRCRTYMLWGYSETSLPSIIEQKIDVVILLPTMEVRKDYYGKGIPDHLMPSDINILIVMDI